MHKNCIHSLVIPIGNRGDNSIFLTNGIAMKVTGLMFLGYQPERASL